MKIKNNYILKSINKTPRDNEWVSEQTPAGAPSGSWINIHQSMDK